MLKKLTVGLALTALAVVLVAAAKPPPPPTLGVPHVVTELVEAPPFGVNAILCPSGEVALSLALSTLTAEGELTPLPDAGWRPITAHLHGRDDVPVGYHYRPAQGTNVVAVTCAPVT